MSKPRLAKPTSTVRNTLGKEQAPQNLVRPVSDEDLREYCDKNYHQILPIIAEKLHQEKAQQEKLKAVKARLNFEEASQYSESETPNIRRNLKERLGPMYARTRSKSPEPRRGRSKSPREKGPERRTVFKRLEKGVFYRLEDKEKNVSAHSRGLEQKSYYSSHRDTESCYQSSRSKETETASEKHRHKREVWFDDLPKESIDSYDDLRKAFLENNLKQKKCIKDPVEIHNIKQRNGESTEEFVRRYKLECRDVKGASECMKTFGFMHGITNPELIKRLHDKIPKSMDEMMSETGQKQNFKRGNFQNEQRMERKQDRFTLLKKTPIEILALDKWKFKPPPPMTTPVEKRNASKFCEFHGEVGHTTDECMHLKRKIEEMLKAGKLSHLIKELKQNHRKDQAKIAKKGETLGKDKPLAILMVQPWKRIARQRITQTFSPKSVISFPTLGEEDGTEGPMIIEAEMGGHCVHRIYVDGGSSSKILYGYCFSKFHPEIKNQLIPANTPLDGFSGEIIWSLRQISLLVRIGDKEHSMSAWMNFMVSTMIIPLECSMVLEPGIPRSAINQVREEKIQVAIHPKYPEQTVAIGSTLTEEGRKELCGLLRRHLDVFAWKPTDMTGVPRHIAEHRLNVREGCLPIRQKKRGQAPERNKAISEELENRVDFKDLNKACPKDGYPLPKIDWKVESLCGYPYKCFLDAYKGYHQIKMAEEDEEKTAFITSQGIFCYSKMSFGLKNDRATYQPAKEAISAVLITERDGKQVPIYFVSRALQGPEINYTLMEKLILALVSASKWLKRYFQAHTIVVITDQPIKQLLSNPKVTRRLLKWRFELGEHDIQYRPRTSVKGQILADFIVERPEDDAPDTPMKDREELPDPWILFTNGSSCIDGSEAGLIITNLEGMKFTYALRFRFNATNNEAEYEALIASLRIARQMGVQNLQANVDSKLVANQVNGIYIAKESSMIRGENKKANALSKISSTSFAHLSKQVLVEELRGKAIDEKEILAVVEEQGLIPAEIGMPTLRTTEVEIVKNNEALGISLDLLEEKREQVAIQEARNRYYNDRVQSTSFRPGDFVYRSNEASHAEDGGKLGPE
nr:reverse transcriptase domain-containing protein [Tanacetum cinerariifolium]